MSTISTVTNRLPCNATSRLPTLDVLSGEQIRLFKGVEAVFQCSLFNGVPSSTTFVTSTANITAFDLYIRRGGPNGTILIHKTVTAGFVNSTYAAWSDGSGQQVSFSLTDSDTNQLVPSDGTLQVYFNIVVTTTGPLNYVAAFGYGTIIDAGLTNLGGVIPQGFTNVYIDDDGVIQNDVLDFTDVTILGLDAIGTGVENTFTVTQTIDTGTNNATLVEGLVLRNDTPGTLSVPNQWAPLIVFEANGYSVGTNHSWEMNEKFFVNQGTGRFMWQFAVDGGSYLDSVYIDYGGNIGSAGYVDCVPGFRMRDVLDGNVICGYFPNLLYFANAAGGGGNNTIRSNDATGPLSFQTFNTSFRSWLFRGTTLTSGNMIEGLLSDTGFTGKIINIGLTSDGVNVNDPVFSFDTAGGRKLTSWASVVRASGFDTFVATPSSANLISMLTTKTGTGNNVFSISPTFTGNPIMPNGTVFVDDTTSPASTFAPTGWIKIKVGAVTDTWFPYYQ